MDNCDSPIKDEAAALNFALMHCLKNNLKPMQVNVDCARIIHSVNNFQSLTAWKINEPVQSIQRLLKSLHNPRLDLIGRLDNEVADRIASQARQNPELSLLARGVNLSF